MIGPDEKTALRTPRQIERSGEELRTQIGKTLHELSGRLTPRHMRAVARRGLTKQAHRVGDTATGTIRRRPKTAAALGLAAGVLLGALLRHRGRRSGPRKGARRLR